ncbi:MAG: hypothetical protein AB7L91_10930 [Dehalococcoidia bacterium]
MDHGVLLRFRWAALVVAVTAVVAVGCGDDDSDFGTVKLAFPLDQADRVAHAALPRVSELPGTGWEVTARDEFSSDSESRGEAERFMASDPACAAIAQLPGFDDAEAGDDPPYARAQVEFQRPGRGLVALPSTVGVSVEVEETSVGVQGAWSLVRPLLESGDFERCMAKLVEQTAAPSNGRTPVSITVTPKEGSVTPPQGGVVFAFDFSVQASVITVDASMEMYLWPYSNAEVTVMFTSAHGDLSADDIEATLRAVDDGMRKAQEREPEDRSTVRRGVR